MPLLILYGLRYCFAPTISRYEPVMNVLACRQFASCAIPGTCGSPGVRTGLECTFRQSGTQRFGWNQVCYGKRGVEQSPTPSTACEVVICLVCGAPDRNQTLPEADVKPERVDEIDRVVVSECVRVRTILQDQRIFSDEASQIGIIVTGTHVIQAGLGIEFPALERV